MLLTLAPTISSAEEGNERKESMTFHDLSPLFPNLTQLLTWDTGQCREHGAAAKDDSVGCNPSPDVSLAEGDGAQ